MAIFYGNRGAPNHDEWPSRIDRAYHAGYDPQPGDDDQPVMNEAELADYFARRTADRERNNS